MRVDDRPTIAAPDDDPYLWLEEVEGARALDFVEQQNRATLEKFGGAPFAADRDTLAAILRPAGQHPLCQRGAAAISTISGRMPKIRAASGGGRRSRISQAEQPTWEIILDVDALAAEEGEDWLLELDAATLPGNARAGDPEPFARRQRRRHAARVRHRRARRS